MNGSGARFSANANAFLTKKEKIVNLKWYESQFSLKKKLISMSYSCFYSEILHKAGKRECQNLEGGALKAHLVYNFSFRAAYA